MVKRVFALLMVMSIVLCGVFSQVGYSAEKSFSFDKYNDETADFNFIQIIRPQLDEKVYKKSAKTDTSFVVSGYTDLDDLRIQISVFNEDTKKYEVCKTDENESFIDIGKSGVLLQEIKLPFKEDNATYKESNVSYKKYDILIKAFRFTGKKELKLQVKKFTINVIDDSLKDKSSPSAGSILESVDRTLKITPKN